METIISSSNESEYNEILRQAIAVIEDSRNRIARAVVSTSNEIGMWDEYYMRENWIANMAMGL